jgi:hypothetical protein
MGKTLSGMVIAVMMHFFNNIYSAIVSKYNNFIKHPETKRGLFSAYSLCSLFYCCRLFELFLNIYLIKNKIITYFIMIYFITE